MRSIKFDILHKNYISVGNTHIFVNFTRYNLEMMNQSHPDNYKKIHVFITNHASINESLKNLVTRYGLDKDIKGKTCKSKVIIHFPHRVTDLRNLLVKFFKSHNINSGYKICFDKYPIRFSPGEGAGPTTYLIFEFPRNFMRVRIQYGDGGRLNLPKIVFPNYPYNVEDAPEEERGIFENMDMRMDPVKFKEDLVKSFKEKTPSGILKAFKNDDEIFEFIVQEGEWKVQADGEEK